MSIARRLAVLEARAGASQLPSWCDAVALATRAGLPPDPWQARLLTSRAKRILINCSRQSGKSSTCAVLAVHTAIYEPGSLTLLLAPTWRQAGELFKKCLAVYRAAGRPVAAASETALTLTLANGSRIVSLPGKEGTVRSYSGVSLLIVDEASRVPADLYHTVRPMLAVSDGRLIAPSTPFGKRGWWSDAWHGGEGWERYDVPATECPRISPAFLAEELRDNGEWWYRQEYGCEFLAAQSAAFRTEDIERAFEGETETWDLSLSA